MISFRLIKTVTTGVQQEIFTAGGQRIILRDNTSYSFFIHGSARSSIDASIFEIQGGVSRGAGVASVVLISAASLIPVMENGIARDLTVQADIVNGTLGVFVTGTGEWRIDIDMYPNPDYEDDSVVSVNAAEIFQDYLDEIGSMTNDMEHKLSASNLISLLKKAVTDWGEDEPLKLKKKIDGTGSTSYVLATILSSLWSHGFSEILSIEYPFGSNPIEIVKRDLFEIYDDGTAQDGSNLILRFVNDVPASDKHFVLEFTAAPYLSDSVVPNFPNTRLNFSKITTLASAYACQRLATAYAQSVDALITADTVNYNDKSSKYTKLSKEYFARYNHLVFGDENPTATVKAAMSQKEITPRSKVGDSPTSSAFLFHGRR